MIREVSGNLLASEADALVNTVNTVGAMGKGIALQFRRAYPAMYEQYRADCHAGKVVPGRIGVWETGALTGTRFILNFPTKRDWRAKSRLEDIETGLEDLVRVVRRLSITSVAVPPLGCGNGGLAWSLVRPLTLRHLEVLEGVEVMLYPPARTPAASEMIDNRPVPPLNPHRRALLWLLRSYCEKTLDRVSLVETQKLAYFLQIEGEPLRLEFTPARYGPYADSLRRTLVDLEGHYISGFGDGSTPVSSAERLTLLAPAEALAPEPETRGRVTKVLDLSDGFDSPYGLELLSTTHWLATRGLRTAEGHVVADSPASAHRLAREWSARKGAEFSEHQVAASWSHLVDHGLIDA